MTLKTRVCLRCEGRGWKKLALPNSAPYAIQHCIFCDGTGMLEYNYLTRLQWPNKLTRIWDNGE